MQSCQSEDSTRPLKTENMDDFGDQDTKKSPDGVAHFKCFQCDKVLFTHQGLKRHISVTHNEDRKYQCPHCSKTFKHQSNYQLHIKGHEGTSSASCNSCGKTFSTRGNLKKHLKTHVTTVEELEELWEKEYMDERAKKYSRRPELLNPKNLDLAEPMPIPRSILMKHTPSKLSGVKKEEIDIQNPSRRGRKRKPQSEHLNLGDLFPNAMDVFMAGIAFPPQFTNPTDQNFIDGNPGLVRNKCPCCEFTGNRREIIDHVKENHQNIYADQFCESCLQKVDEMEDHRMRHAAAEALGQLSPNLLAMGRSILNQNESRAVIMDQAIRYFEQMIVQNDSQVPTVSGIDSGRSEEETEVDNSSELMNDGAQWERKIEFEGGTDRSGPKLIPTPGEPNCYKIGGKVNVLQEFKGDFSIYLELRTSASKKQVPEGCQNQRPDGCGGFGSCLYCNACETLTSAKGVNAKLLLDGIPIKCGDGLKPGNYENLELVFCLPDIDEILQSQGLSKETFKMLVTSEDGQSFRSMGIFATVYVFDTDVSKLMQTQAKVEAIYRKSKRSFFKDEPLPPEVYWTLPFNKMIKDQTTFVACHKIYGNIKIKST